MKWDSNKQWMQVPWAQTWLIYITPNPRSLTPTFAPITSKTKMSRGEYIFQNTTDIQWNLSVTTTSRTKFITFDLFSNVF